eukprot:GEMP01049365.1.p1 GENE.GEMP01049365.1~~GEMP01049365.1.p1  ORF type:complete len:390 (+),score=91.51 GEMP01049365.1:316-1485(+)
MFSLNTHPSDGILKTIRARVEAHASGDIDVEANVPPAPDAPIISSHGVRPASARSAATSASARLTARLDARQAANERNSNVKDLDTFGIPYVPTEDYVELVETDALFERLAHPPSLVSKDGTKKTDCVQSMDRAAKVYRPRPRSAPKIRCYETSSSSTGAHAKALVRPKSEANSAVASSRLLRNPKNNDARPAPSVPSSADASSCLSQQSSIRSMRQHNALGVNPITDQDSALARDCAQVSHNWAKDVQKLKETKSDLQKADEEIKRLQRKNLRLQSERSALQAANEASTRTVMRLDELLKASEFAREKAETRLRRRETCESTRVAEASAQRIVVLEAALQDATRRLREIEELGLESKIVILKEELQKKDQRLRQLLEKCQNSAYGDFI